MSEPFQPKEQPFNLRREMSTLMTRCQQPGKPVRGTLDVVTRATSAGIQFRRDSENRLIIPVPNEDGDKDTYFLDEQGRVARFEHKIRREGEAARDEFITFSYDGKGRLTNRAWYSQLPNEAAILSYEEYSYPAGRPDEEYTRYIEPQVEGKTRIAQTYELRKLDGYVGNIWTSPQEGRSNFLTVAQIQALVEAYPSLAEIVAIVGSDRGIEQLSIAAPAEWPGYRSGQTIMNFDSHVRLVRYERPDFVAGKNTEVKEFTYTETGRLDEVHEMTRTANGELDSEKLTRYEYTGTSRKIVEVPLWPMHRLQGALATLPQPGQRYEATTENIIAERLPIIGAVRRGEEYVLTRHLDSGTTTEFTYDQFGRCVRMFVDHPQPLKGVSFQRDEQYQYDKLGRLVRKQVLWLSPDATGEYKQYFSEGNTYFYPDNQPDSQFETTRIGEYPGRAPTVSHVAPAEE